MAKRPQTLRQTLTWDRRSEMANHAKIAEETNLAIYFCDPASPWPRGSNENTVSIEVARSELIGQAGAGNSR